MKSSIKIDFADLERGKGLEPIITVKIVPSEDVRDTLLKTMFQNAGDKLNIKFVSQNHLTNPEGLPEMISTIMLYRTDEVTLPSDTELENNDRKLATDLLEFIVEHNFVQGGHTKGQWIRNADGRNPNFSNEQLYDSFLKTKEPTVECV